MLNNWKLPSCRGAIWCFNVVIFILVMTATSGCSLEKNYRRSPEFSEKRSSISRIGLLPMHIVLSEERLRMELVANAEWSTLAENTVSRAVADIMLANGKTMVPVSSDDMELADIKRLASAVDISIYRHAMENPGQSIPPMETFPALTKSLNYSLGSLELLAERYHVDTFIVVNGHNFLPTEEVLKKEQVDTFTSLLAAIGGMPVPVLKSKKVQLRAMIVDRSGRVLYYGYADRENHGTPVQPSLISDAYSSGYNAMAVPVENDYIQVDLRDYRVAHYYLTAALSGLFK